MPFWTGELKELDKLYESFKGHLPDIVKEMEQLIKTDDPNVVMLYSRRCLEVIVTDLCEIELKRPRKTEPLKGIIDKLNSEEKVPSHIITSMQSLNSMATYGTHPKDFDPEQVKPVLNNLAIIIRWYLKYKDFQIVSKTEPIVEKHEEKHEEIIQKKPVKEILNQKKKSLPFSLVLLIAIIIVISVVVILNIKGGQNIIPANYPDGLAYSTFTDTRDNQVYKEIKIGDQIWMAENLKAVRFNDGTPIPRVKDEKEWEHLITPAYCWYNNNRSAYKETYGVLYNWFAVNSGKLCPVGWHVPSNVEWRTLTTFLGDSLYNGKERAAIKLKETDNLHWTFNDTVFATNDYGFTALPGGERTVYGVFFGLGDMGCWWSSTEAEYIKGNGRNIEIDYEYNGVTDIEQYKQFGMSVRCVKD